MPALSPKDVSAAVLYAISVKDNVQVMTDLLCVKNHTFLKCFVFIFRFTK